MKKEEIYVVIDSEEKRLKAIQILSDAGEILINHSSLLGRYKTEMELKFNSDFWWVTNDYNNNKQEITLDQLEQLLSPKQEVKMELDALKLIAESYGFELIEKTREIKVGDFGKFWDSTSDCPVYGYLQLISKGVYIHNPNSGSSFRNFAHLTDDEKAQLIQKL
jgi:hypothetical protein